MASFDVARNIHQPLHSGAHDSEPDGGGRGRNAEWLGIRENNGVYGRVLFHGVRCDQRVGGDNAWGHHDGGIII
jgi:hypothetical protein